MFLLVPAYPGGPGQKAVKRLCVCVCLCARVRARCVLCCVVYDDCAQRHAQTNMSSSYIYGSRG